MVGMANFIDIHTHHTPIDGQGVVNFRLGKESAVPLSPFSAGIHPWDSAEAEAHFEELAEVLKNPLCVALGEVGLDKACGVDWGVQVDALTRQLSLAQHRPIIVHCVRAQSEMVEILGQHKELQSVIFHGFISSKEQAGELTKRGYHLSFGFGALASPRTIEALRICPEESLFLETDTSPRPIEELYRLVAEIRGVEIERLKEIIDNNFNRVFIR